ncbi:MAG TPA: HEAT repeat domain-containing protein, partial [Candidatus Polarisedimenticolia bacterium]|nr:HEAT repeat domain-containing protein [Candidatus Polarisedimenticolia bacterium]
EGMRRQAMEGLGFMKRSDLVVPYLKATLEGKESNQVRAGAAEGLAHHPSKDIVRLLAGHARTDRSADVRRACVEAMGQMQSPEALEELLSIARAGEASGGAKHAAYEALSNQVSERAYQESQEPEKTTWKREDADEEDAQDTQEDQVLQDEPSVPLPDEELQRQAVEALGRYPEAQSLPQLRKIAETSPSGALRSQAVESIGRLGTPAALQVIEQVAWKNRMEEARHSAVEAIGKQYPQAYALDRLASIARGHPSRETRRAAVEMVGRFDSPRAQRLLREVIDKGKDQEVQRQAVESLGRRDEPGVDAQLLEIARTHRSIDVRRQAVESLGRRESKRVANELTELARTEGPEDVQRQAVESLGRLDQDVMPELEKIARSHPSSTVRHQAVESMMRRDPDRALKIIEEILREPKGKSGA